jgi:hypothetical protein
VKEVQRLMTTVLRFIVRRLFESQNVLSKIKKDEQKGRTGTADS